MPEDRKVSQTAFLSLDPDFFLVPPGVEQVDLRFPRDGIDYDSLTDEEKAGLRASAEHYVENARRYVRDLKIQDDNV